MYQTANSLHHIFYVIQFDQLIGLLFSFISLSFTVLHVWTENRLFDADSFNLSIRFEWIGRESSEISTDSGLAGSNRSQSLKETARNVRKETSTSCFLFLSRRRFLFGSGGVINTRKIYICLDIKLTWICLMRAFICTFFRFVGVWNVNLVVALEWKKWLLWIDDQTHASNKISDWRIWMAMWNVNLLKFNCEHVFTSWSGIKAYLDADEQIHNEFRIIGKLLNSSSALQRNSNVDLTWFQSNCPSDQLKFGWLWLKVMSKPKCKPSRVG